jgi:hypothetical protein
LLKHKDCGLTFGKRTQSVLENGPNAPQKFMRKDETWTDINGRTEDLKVRSFLAGNLNLGLRLEIHFGYLKINRILFAQNVQSTNLVEVLALHR